MGLKGLLVATTLVFSVIVYMVIADPTISLIYEQTSTGTVADQGLQSQADFIKNIALMIVPTAFIIGIIVYAYASIQKSESFFGAGGPR